MAFPGIVPIIRKFVFGDTALQLTKTMQTFYQSVGVQEVYIDINAIKAIQEGFNKNAAVYSIVMKFASKFGNIPRYVYDAGAKEEKAEDNTIDKNNPLVKLINRPNEYESQDCFYQKVCAYWKVCGEAMIWLNRGIDVNDYRLPDNSFDNEKIKVLPVIEMYVLPTDRVNPLPDPDNPWGIIGWRLDLGGVKMDIPKANVIHWKMTSLLSEFPLRNNLRGFSPLEAGYKTLQQNNSMSDASVRMAQNDGARGALVDKTLGVSQTPMAKTQVEKVMNEKVNNTEVKAKIAAFQGDWDYLNFGQTATDMQLLEGKEMSWKELCFLLSVPYEFFDSKTTYANKEQAQKGWVTNDIIPACKQLDGEMNRVLLVAFGMENSAFIETDYSELPEMQQDMNQQATALAAAWWISPNEKREIMSEEPVADPQLDELWIPQGLSPLSQSGNDAEMQALQSTIDAMRQKPNGSGTQNQVPAGSNGKVPAQGT
jgi:HK97 family phage portal protein